MLFRSKFDGLVKAYPRVLFKYLGRQYLANQLSTAERGEALVHHYRFMHETFSASFVRSVVFDDAEVWNDGRGHAMTLGYSDPVDQEGELSLVFRRRGTAIFTLSFSFVPGRLCSLEDAHVLLITRIQGTKGCFEDIRMATRLMEDVSPANVLLACAAGIGLAADVHQIIGVAGRQQSSNHGEPTLTAHLIEIGRAHV